MTDNTDITVTRNDVEGRYEIRLGDTLAGYTVFQPVGSELVFPHTVIDPAFGGRGLGSILVGQAMTDVAERGETIVPLCPFVLKYLSTHDVPGLKIDYRDADL